MVYRRDHTEAEIEALAARFREDWTDGQLVRPWLRRHSEELWALVRDDDWAWANIGKAMTLAGIAFKTGNAWTGENLRRSVDLAMKPRKGRRKKRQSERDAPSVNQVHPTPDGGPGEFRIVRRRDSETNPSKGEP